MNRQVLKLKKVIKKRLRFSTRQRTNLFIIGEQKCGTTSLYKLLTRNANILAATAKECHYFNTNKILTDKGYKKYHKEYRQPFYKKYLYQIDATPDYLSDKKAAELIQAYNPEAKIIIVLRNPASRFISAYNFYFSNVILDLEVANKLFFQFSENGNAKYKYLKENPGLSIQQFLDDELNGKSPFLSLKRGHYFEHIQHWEQYFDKSNMRILSFENLISPGKMPAEISILEEFLSLSLDTNFPKENISALETIVPADVILKLENYYQFEISQLEKMSDRKNNNFEMNYYPETTLNVQS